MVEIPTDTVWYSQGWLQGLLKELQSLDPSLSCLVGAPPPYGRQDDPPLDRAMPYLEFSIFVVSSVSKKQRTERFSASPGEFQSGHVQSGVQHLRVFSVWG